jgi:hypothetical protein
VRKRGRGAGLAILQFRKTRAQTQRRGKIVNRDRLKKLAAEKRFIPGIYNYCDRWCERCPKTSRCLNFSISEEEFSDPEMHDIRNEAFWRKLSEILGETLELLREIAEECGIEPENLGSMDDIEKIKTKDVAAENHLICRAAKSYSKMVEDWFGRKEKLFFEAATVADEGVALEEAFEVIRWYQYFIAAKVMRAIRGKMEDEEEGCDEFASDSDGSAKIALIAIDRSIGAWAVIPHPNHRYAEEALEMISFLDRLRQAIEQTFPRARSFIRPGFDRTDLDG